jgi:hypothetical protein
MPLETHTISKANNIEAALRLAEVKRLLLQCKETAEIVQFGADKWGISHRQMYKYIAKASKDIRKELGRRDAISMTWHIKARRNLIDRAMESNELQVAQRVMQDIAKLQGLYVEKHEHAGPDGAPIPIQYLPESAKE